MIEHLYIHIPFCQDICSYCDFCKVFYRSDYVDAYLEQLEIDIKLSDISSLKTIYIGGGTPSALNEFQLEKLLKILKPYCKSCLEYSIELNPESTNINKLKLLKEHGVNRLSFGVQTFNEDILKLIDRHHTNNQVFDLIALAKSLGFNNINIDLMYGLPNQTNYDLEHDLTTVIALGITHISYYSLILEDHTKLKKIDYQPIDDETSYLINKRIDDILAKNGFKKYEVSNYAHDGFQSIHNRCYWEYKDYLGLGIGATSKIGNKIQENSRSLNNYLKGNRNPKIKILSLEESLFNEIMMGLRLLEGIDIKKLNKKYQINFLEKYQNSINKYLNKYLFIEDNHLFLTTESIYYLNEILLDFL